MFEEYPDVMRVSHVQKALHIGRNTAYKIIDSNELHHICVGRNIRIPKPYLIDYVLGVKQNINIQSIKL